MAAAALVAAAALAFVALRGSPAPSGLQDRVRAVASTLRCPVCQDLSVADSPSAIAREMRAEIGRDLRAGMTPAAIRAYFVSRYGDWILLSPPRSGLNLLVWIAPVLLLVAGLAAGVLAVRRWVRDGPASVDDASERAVPGAGSAPARMSDADRRLLDRALATAEDET